MTLPLVSICIPTYNRAAFLKEAIESALATDYPNIEIVISDNASTDDTAQVVQGFNDDRIRYFKNERNIGAFLNFRKLLYEYAQGEYAIYLSDDNIFIDSSYIFSAVSLLQNNQDVTIVFSNWKRLQAETGKSRNFTLNLERISSGVELCLNYYYKKNKYVERTPLMFYSALFKRNIAIDIDAMSPECLEVDVPFMLKIAARGQVGYLDNISVAHRIHKGNVSAHCSCRIYLEFMFKIGNEIEKILKSKGVSSAKIHSVKLMILKQDRNATFGQILLDIANKKENIISVLTDFNRKIYKEYPFLLLFYLSPRVVLQMIIVNFPSLYFFFRKKFGRRNTFNTFD